MMQRLGRARTGKADYFSRPIDIRPHQGIVRIGPLDEGTAMPDQVNESRQTFKFTCGQAESRLAKVPDQYAHALRIFRSPQGVVAQVLLDTLLRLGQRRRPNETGDSS